MTLAELLPDEDFRFHLTVRRGDPAEFFRPQDASGRLLAERAAWIAREPSRYAALRREGETLLDEFAELATPWAGEQVAKVRGEGHTAAEAERRIRAWGAALEPDFLLLSAEGTGEFHLRGGALCFPTGWALEEKLGRPMSFIHGVVPGLNAALAGPIHQLLAKLRPGAALLRDNWGLAATDELNLHPARGLPGPTPPVRLDELWLRVEHQALVALPRAAGIVFGIRIALHRLDAVARDAAAARGLRRALATMPASVAGYKRVDEIRAAVIRLL